MALLVVILWLLLRPGGGEEPAEETPVVAAATAEARVQTFEVTVEALGTVAPVPGHAAQVAAPAATRVTGILVGTGDRVRAGQTLLTLDASVWAAQLAQAQAAYTAAQQAYDRAERLVKEGILPRKDEETAASDLAQARASLAEAQRLQSLSVIRSPINGVVTAVNATLSQSVDANQPLVEIVDPTTLEVLFHLSPDDAAKVAPGDVIHLTSGVGSGAQPVGTGIVHGISAAIDSTTGSVPVRATVRASRPLRVGETVSGRIVVASHEHAVVVPVAALVPVDEGMQVFTVSSDSTAHVVPVTVGGRNEAIAEVTSGLTGGEVVVTSGAYGMTDGAHVQPQPRSP
ncbi:MAG TPA: efflux RND transporter periplasmic adaptor subunit [Rhodothermales bacterium]|nr:efflux RND transporter periplasmic adaptor subunit [Rhodothermales bacterium]